MDHEETTIWGFLCFAGAIAVGICGAMFIMFGLHKIFKFGPTTQKPVTTTQ